MDPSWGAVNLESLLRKEPIGVRVAATMYTSLSATEEKFFQEMIDLERVRMDLLIKRFIF